MQLQIKGMAINQNTNNYVYMKALIVKAPIVQAINIIEIAILIPDASSIEAPYISNYELILEESFLS